MSKKKSSSENDDRAPDLSALDFGPAWARQDKNTKPHKPQQGKSSHGSRPDGDGVRHGGHGGGKNRGRGERERGFQGRDDRRRDHGRRDDRGDYKKDGRQRTPMAPPAEGVSARIMPIEEGMDAMAKQISATGRTHSVFELAWVVLGGLDRFHVIFESEELPLYRSNTDHSVWLTQKECMAHMWSSGLIKRYYDEEITEVDAPSGNFQSVARCGFSGRLIGPPNHHAYQQTLLDLHREKFSNMALERYKAKIVMEHSEEAVQEWIDSMRQHKRWRPKAEQAAETEDQPEGKADAPSDVQTPDVPDQDEAADAAVEAPAPEPAPVPVIEETVVILDNHREVEQHFLTHGFGKEFESGKMMSTLASIPARMISPGLMTVLRNVVAEEKRYPGNLASILCRQMSGRHLAVYKWKKRLHCGPARPKHVPDEMVMADRPSALFHWVIKHPGGSIDTMWKDCLPAGIDDAGRHTWYHDLHWLINEGLVLLFSDGTLHAAKELEKKPVQQKARADKPGKQGKKKEASQDSAEKVVTDGTPGATVESPGAPSPEAKADPPAAEPLSPGKDQDSEAN
ncbi:MAG: hypothetical protein H7A51_07520 [Akkermansiaceae bacterium]|nr:hypothetical protein [Akkermansiaceae bacterium]